MPPNEDLEKAEGAGGETKPQATKGPSSVSEAYKMFQQKQSEKAKGKPPEEPSDKTEKEGEKEPSQPKEGDKPTPFPYRLVDKDGNEVPFPMKVDGKDLEESDLSKVNQWAQLGYHGNKRLEEVNLKEKSIEEREKEIQTQMEELKTSNAMLEKFKSAIEEGRLVINPPGDKPGKEEPAEEKIDEDLYSDPAMLELKKENVQLKKDLKGLTEKFEAGNKLILGKLVKETKDVLDADIVKAKETYPLLSEKEVWDLLAETKDGKPVYDVETAAKLSNSKQQEKFTIFLKDHPEFQKKDEDEKKKIIAEYLEKKAEAEKAPVSPPSSSAAQTPSTKEKPKKEFKSMKEAAAAANVWLQQKMAAKKQM